ncbi:MAG: toll/interleukin-1 receptor domain-containing protein [Deltaproteobacteria bacterium]|nr:toll/interleukin-1 receptor domain-containing protein [Deltaproteobacteria bacterium]
MSDTISLLTGDEIKACQQDAAEASHYWRVLGYHAPELLGDKNWAHVQKRLKQRLRLDLLTLAPGGLAERLEVVAAERLDAPLKLRESRALKLQRQAEAQREGWELNLRELDWIPSVGMFLCYDQPPPDGSKPVDCIREGFIGVVTPDPTRRSKDKVWMHLRPEAGKGAEALRSYAEQYEALWQRAQRPPPRSVFLSYAHEDHAAADQVEAVLRRAGVEVFRDEAAARHGAVAIEGMLKAQLDTCGALLILWSEAWEASMWCRAEANHVLQRGIAARPVIDVLKVGPTRSPAPDLRLLGHLYRPAEDRISRQSAAEAVAAASTAWSVTPLAGEVGR